jgi:glycosyltransferase involved in cell wall biosynthesis
VNEKQIWGGDLRALNDLKKGLELLGHTVQEGHDPLSFLDADYFLLANTCLDLREPYQLLKGIGERYGVICFHEDRRRFCGPASGFVNYIDHSLSNETEFPLENLFTIPHAIDYFSSPLPKNIYFNYEVIRDAAVCVANAPSEAATLKRDCPSCNAQVVPLRVEVDRAAGDSFLQATGLKQNGYILQIGRMEPRKNQLGSILATRDLDIPLVFIATSSYHRWYEEVCLQAIAKWRKAPTLIISQTIPPGTRGLCTVTQMPGGQCLPFSFISSALKNAALYLHPAFYELPGYTYLEAAAYGTPVVASAWGSLTDYLPNDKTLGGQIAHCTPHDIPALTQSISSLLGKRFPTPTLPCFSRTCEQIASDFLKLIDKS